MKEASIVYNFEHNYNILKSAIERHNNKKSIGCLFTNTTSNSISFYALPKEILTSKQM